MQNKLHQGVIAAILLLYGYLYATLDYSADTAPYGWQDSAFYIVECLVFLFWAILMVATTKKPISILWAIITVFFSLRFLIEIYVAINGVPAGEKQSILTIYIISCILIIITKCRWE